MIQPDIEKELCDRLHELPRDVQLRVLDFARSLDRYGHRGVDGRTLLRFAGSIPEDDLRVMSAEIESSCETVIVDEW